MGHKHGEGVEVVVKPVRPGRFGCAIYWNHAVGSEGDSAKIKTAGEWRDQNRPKEVIGSKAVTRVVEAIVDLAALGQQDDVHIVAVARIGDSRTGNLYLCGPPGVDSQ